MFFPPTELLPQNHDPPSKKERFVKMPDSVVEKELETLAKAWRREEKREIASVLSHINEIIEYPSNY